MWQFGGHTLMLATFLSILSFGSHCVVPFSPGTGVSAIFWWFAEQLAISSIGRDPAWWFDPLCTQSRL